MLMGVPPRGGGVHSTITTQWVKMAIFNLIDYVIEHGFTSAPTQYRLYGRRFLQV